MPNYNELLPTAFKKRMCDQLGIEADAFFQALQIPSPTSIRKNPEKLPTHSPTFFHASPIPWCEEGLYLTQRPVFTLDPCFHGGAYYVQEASSMFLKHILKQFIPSSPIRVLDLCAAPGGKSTLIASMLGEDSILVSNEVIRSRATILKENIIKWGNSNVIVTQNDPSDFKSLTGAFDFILVDAPCSGEGMFRKDPNSIEAWSENNLKLCSERQRRILSDIWPCLKPGGKLIYSTCTYNPEENEAILEWLIQEWQAESVPIIHSFDGVSVGNSSVYGYHFYPHRIQGEGFFIGVVQKSEGEEFILRKNKKQSHASCQFPKEIIPFLQKTDCYSAYLSNDIIGIVPKLQFDFISKLESTLHVLYKGCEIAEINNRKIKLRPALALWKGLNKNNCFIYDTDISHALAFLHKEELPIPNTSADWLLISYQGIGLGWCKNLGNRLNNYYPKEWRIKMEITKS